VLSSRQASTNSVSNDYAFCISYLAAIVRKIYLRPGTGVGALKKRFGGNYRYVNIENQNYLTSYSSLVYFVDGNGAEDFDSKYTKCLLISDNTLLRTSLY
jgi:hypothetical protein